MGEDSGASQKIGKLEPSQAGGAFYPEEIRSVEYPPFFAEDFQTVEAESSRGRA